LKFHKSSLLQVAADTVPTVTFGTATRQLLAWMRTG
jgi:hypothetical protein